MRKIFLAFVTSAIVFFTGLRAASAQDYPYCIQGDDFAGRAGECISSTHAQGRATASSRSAFYTEHRDFGANAHLLDRSHARRRSN
jgi:hypothetical protein